jgi:hypothetical protein
VVSLLSMLPASIMRGAKAAGNIARALAVIAS